MSHLASDMNIGQLMADEKFHMKIIFFFEKKAVTLMTFLPSRQANSANL